jgi:hypothetical protein
MRFKKTRYLIPLLILTIIITFCSFSCSTPSPSDQTIEEPAQKNINENSIKEPEEKVEEEVAVEEPVVEEVLDEEEAVSTGEKEEEEEVEEEKEAPTITLEIYEGPTLSNDICYYRVKAIVTGNPGPDIDFSKDDSKGAWGDKKTQVNLSDPGETYTLTATAINSEGSDTDSIELSWGCELPELEKDSNFGTSDSSGIYSKQEIEYFFEIAFGAEYGYSGSVLHKWASDIRIRVNGTPTNADLDTLNQIVAELNTLVSSISFSIVTDNPNVDIYFTNVSQFPSIEPNYISGNMGFAWIWWDAAGDIFKGRILIALDGVNQQVRSHLIREELTQSAGLMKDSWRYQESVFYQGWTGTTAYAQIDRALIKLLYDPRLRSGMTQDQVKDALDIN